MIGIAGSASATEALLTHSHGTTRIITTPVRKTSTTTARGPRFRTTVQCGVLPPGRIGLLIVPGVGYTSRTMAGHGSPMSLGAGRLITMAAGSFTVVTGS